ncbi:MAG: YdcF family protein [Rhizobiaceae bacterium]
MGAMLSTLLRWLGPAVLLSLAAFLIGFALFSERVSRMGEPSAVDPADAIVVLTGGQSRIEAALDLLGRNKGERLLISGVNQGTSKQTLRKAFADDKSLFDCCVDIGYEAKSTVGNAAETISWLRSHDYREIILVTNNYHMARSLLELQRLDPRLTIAPYPVVNSDLSNGKWMMNAEVVRVLLAEYIKYIGAVSRRVLPVPSSLATMTGG